MDHAVSVDPLALRSDQVRAQRIVVLGIAASIGIGGACIALLAPGAWFDGVLAQLIGGGGHAHTTVAQRVIAVCGALTGATAFIRWGGFERARLALSLDWRVWLVAIPFALVVVRNLTYAGASLDAWGWPHPVPRELIVAVAAVMLVGCVIVLMRATSLRQSSDRVYFATGCGVAYGCFSALWHCCPALWTLEPR
jgi:hypothetical protein